VADGEMAPSYGHPTTQETYPRIVCRHIVRACVCVCEREREREGVCVCVFVCEETTPTQRDMQEN
jgi:hypothetical protein